MQIFEGVGECMGASFLEEMPQAEFDFGCFAERFTPLSFGTQFFCDGVSLLVFGYKLLDLSI